MELKTLLQPLVNDMRAVDLLIQQRLTSDVALINEVARHLILAGGKRMRPALVVAVAQALAGDMPKAHKLAACIEFIHTATLLHDDVVDHSDLRRGRKTANSVWGNEGAVLSGDFLYTRSFQMMVEVADMEALRMLADTTNAIAEGEVMQLLNAGDPDVDEARYLKVIELKTAVLFRASALAGAYCSTRDESLIRAAGEYGYCLGMAFQLVDDVLDYAADPEQSGKALGNDLAEGKPTLPLIHAMQNGTPEQVALIRACIENGGEGQLEPVLKAIDETGSLPYTAELAGQFSAKAIEALNPFPEGEFKQALKSLAEFAVERVS